MREVKQISKEKAIKKEKYFENSAVFFMEFQRKAVL